MKPHPLIAAATWLAATLPSLNTHAGALPAAAAVVLLLWLVGPRHDAPGQAAAVDGALAERIFAEALQS
jgi:hypothetical protein